jgi:2-polyprenyl-3-methyl-5-hydroxy-6-metoxy-1,4-benzoquinol methylase
MTIAESSTEFETSGWGWACLASSDLALLAEFTQLTEEECVSRLRASEPGAMALAWEKAAPTTSTEIRSFYAETNEYLWELMAWNSSRAYDSYLARVARLTELFPPRSHPRALDYGSGVGTVALRLAKLGYDVTLADVPGSTFEFARERLRARGCRFDVLEIHDDVPVLPLGAWDIVVSFDVLEHVVAPRDVTKALVGALASGGGAALVASFAGADSYPLHLKSGVGQFADHRWPLYLQSLGMKHVGSDVYLKTDRLGTVFRRMRYAFWRATGLYVEHLKR